MLIKLYKNYGVLGHEKKPVYCTKPMTMSYDIEFYELPEQYIVHIEVGKIWVGVDGYVNDINDTIVTKYGKPYLLLRTHRKEFKLVKLEEVKN